MSFPLTLPEFARLRVDARRNLERAVVHQEDMKALVVRTDEDVRHAAAALSPAPSVTRACVHPYEMALRGQLQRSEDAAAAARQLCAAAGRDHQAAARLLWDLGERGADSQAEQHKASQAVLVADDYGDVRELLQHVLNAAGFTVRTAANGLEALIAAYEMRPAVIVMDLSMPVLDGIEATRLIKKVEALRHAQVIAYTGEQTIERHRSRPLFAAVLQKPVCTDTLIATVQQYVNV